MERENKAVDAASADAQINETPNESADAGNKGDEWYREEIRKIASQRDDFKQRSREVEEQLKQLKREELEKTQQYQTLYEDTKAELEKMQSIESKLTTYEETVKTMLTKSAEGIDDEIAEAIISNDNLTPSDKITRLEKLKATVSRPLNSPASETPNTKMSNKAYADIDFFRSIENDSSAQYDLLNENPALHAAFIKWQTQKFKKL